MFIDQAIGATYRFLSTLKYSVAYSIRQKQSKIKENMLCIKMYFFFCCCCLNWLFALYCTTPYLFKYYEDERDFEQLELLAAHFTRMNTHYSHIIYLGRV